MKTILIIVAIAFGGLLLVGAVGAIGALGVYNTQANLKVTYDAKVKANEAVFDNLWKKVSQVAQVPDAQKNALKEVLNSYASARTGTGDGGSLMKWVQESVPNTDGLSKTYTNLQNIIAGSRRSE